MKNLPLLIICIVTISFTGCDNTKPKPIANQVEQINTNILFEKSAITLFNARPSSATMFGIDEKLAGGKFSHRLGDYSPKAEAKLRKDLSILIDEMKPAKSQDENNRVMQNITRYYSGNPDFEIGYIDTWMGLSAFVVNQINGPLIDIPNVLVANHQINNVEDASDYFDRVCKFDVLVNSVVEKITADANSGWIPPKVIIEKSINGLNSFIAPEPDKHPFVIKMQTSLEKLDGIDKKLFSEFISNISLCVENIVYPAYRSVIDLQTEFGKVATTKSGIWAQPNGEKFYKDAVKMLGDTDLSPQEIHQLGLDEVARITIEMDLIMKSQGLTKGTVGQRMLGINDNPKFLYEDSESGREQLLEDINGYIKEISNRMDEQFATRPKYQVEVRKFPKSREESAPGGMYTNPPLDGSQPGIYWINLRDIKANPKFDLKTLTYHEAIPGHHWQVALNLEQNELPMLRRMAPYNAYVEGWALYSEKVAEEMGLYKTDPFSNLGRLKAELFRAVRLVVDTGLHYKKWSRKQAIKYMAETTGTVESDVVAEIERYMVWPAQALGYKLGMINLLKLRADAKKQLGDKFDIKAFHDLILLGGAVPMDILDAKVADWIKQKKI